MTVPVTTGNTDLLGRRSLLIFATVFSTLAAVLGAIWLFRPDLDFFYADPNHAVLAKLAGPRVAEVTQTVLALLGVATGIAALNRLISDRAVIIGGLVQVAGFGVVLQSMNTLLTLGYLMALAMPVIIIVLLVQVIRRYPRARWLVGLPGLLVVAALIIFGRQTVVDLGRIIVVELSPHLPRLSVIMLILLTGFSWAAATVTIAARTGAMTKPTDWVLRHRVVITIVAACGPLPYELLRLTWLTPWPIFGQPDDNPPMRVWGLALSSAAWLGSILTIGLLRRWSEVFPRWVPVVAGRRVPIAAAAVPAGLVAAGLCFTAVPLLLEGDYSSLMSAMMSVMVIPAWLWGPALALAVWGYIAHRQRTDRKDHDPHRPTDDNARLSPAS